jgi:ABC-type transport system involved in cytochrome c biogenesis permease component
MNAVPTTRPSANLSLLSSFRRIGVLAGHTFTQLVRMKIFYFMLVFCLVLFVSGFLLASISPDQELKLLKDTAFGVMQIFSAIFGIMAMALLLPKDIEDRTLYTILSKPVRRWEYLLGKYCGVLLVLLVSLVVMDAMACGALHAKFKFAESQMMGFYDEQKSAGKITEEDYQVGVSDALTRLREQGVRWQMQTAVVAIFLKAAVATALALLVSTFAGSTIFTILVAISIYVIGHLQAGARESLLQPPVPHSHGIPVQVEPPGVITKVFAGVISVTFPDFQVYNVVDSIVTGKTIPGGALMRMAGLTAVYLIIYLGLAAFVFSSKEL